MPVAEAQQQLSPGQVLQSVTALDGGVVEALVDGEALADVEVRVVAYVHSAHGKRQPWPKILCSLNPR
jgi:hypothetical protein